MRFLTELNVGDYVEYRPKLSRAVVPAEHSGYFSAQVYSPEKASCWRVFKTEDQSDFGKTELICSDSVMSLTLNGEQGYNNAFNVVREVCNSIAFHPLHTDEASEPIIYARTVGCAYFEKFYSDTTKMASEFSWLLAKDVKWMRSNGLMPSNEWTWIPVSEYTSDKNKLEFAVKTLHISGCITNIKTLVSVEPNNGKKEFFHTCGVLPILAMPTCVTIASDVGDGSKENPYKIEW